MVDFMLGTFGNILQKFGLYKAIKNVQFGFSHNAYHLYSILEMCNLSSGIFFTPVRELGFILYEMFEVSLFSMGELPYKEYVLTFEELNQIREKDISVYKTYGEILSTLEFAPRSLG